MYFKYFPTVKYDFTVKSDAVAKIDIIPDLTARVVIRITPESLDKLCEQYRADEGETPESIAYKLYKDPMLHWTILYVNDIANIYKEWPMSENSLLAYVERKYGVANRYSTHHFEKLPEMVAVSEEFMDEMLNTEHFIGEEADATVDTFGEVSNYEYESRKNEMKRFIKVVSPMFISSFVTMFENALAKNAE